MSIEIEEHGVSDEEHRKTCSFCSLCYSLSELLDGHPMEEVWEAVASVLLNGMSNFTDDDDLFLKAARHFQMDFTKSALSYLLQRQAERERAEMH